MCDFWFVVLVFSSKLLSLYSRPRQRVKHKAHADALSFDNTFNRVQDRLKISELEARFATLWDAAGGPERQREYRFAPPRRRRAAPDSPGLCRRCREVSGGHAARPGRGAAGQHAAHA